MTSTLRGLFIGVLALIGLALAGAQPAQAQQFPFACGNVAVNTNYVLPQNCVLACQQSHTPAQCAQLVPLCRRCWGVYLSLVNNKTIPAAQKCKVATDRYAACMKPFFK